MPFYKITHKGKQISGIVIFNNHEAIYCHLAMK